MAIKDWSATPASNTAISGINIAEGCPPSGINDAIRQMMADLKAADFGTSAPKTDTIAESTAAAGVTVDGVLLKDGTVKTDTILESTLNAGVTIDGLLIKDGTIAGIGAAIKVSSDDTTVGYLEGKLIATSNSGLVLATNSPGGNEVRTISVDLDTDPGLELGAGGLKAKVKAASGLNLDADGLWLDLGTDSALEFSADGLEVKLASNGGLTKSAGGLAVSGGGGEWEEVTAAKTTASASASVAFTGLDATTYDYRVVMRSVKPATNAVTMRVETGHGATPTYRAQDYTVAVSATNQAGTAVGFGSVDQAIAVITGSLTTANQSDRVDADLAFLYDDVADITMRGTMSIVNDNGGGGASATAIALNLAMINVSLGFTALRFTMSSGNIASGVFRLYRRAR